MKRCPECRKDYFDDSLLYCLDDGAALVQGGATDEPPTALLSGDRTSNEAATRTLGNERVSKSPDKRTLFSSQRLPWILAAIFALVGVAGLTSAFWKRSSDESGSARLAFDPPAALAFSNVQPDWAVISPDGRKIAFSGTADGKNMLYVRELNSSEAKLLPGSDNPLEPFWSPDSKSVAYGSNGKLKRSDLSGGNAQVLCDSARMLGGSWNKEGTIIFVPDYRTKIVQVSAIGGEPSLVPMNDGDDDGATGRHRYPYFLPDGRRFIFLRQEKGSWIGSLDSPEITQILPDTSPVVYSKQGYIIFIRNNSLVAQEFDADKRTVSGEIFPLITDQKTWTNFFRFSASDNGTLVWQGTWERDYQLVWYDREGKQTGTLEAPSKVAAGQDPRLSPDGKRVVIKRNPPNTIWVVDLEKGNSVRITSDFGQMPLWSPDGSRILYAGSLGLMIKASTGLGEPEMVLPSSASGATFPCCWSPDGKFIVYQKRGVKTRLDLYAMALDDKKEVPLLISPFDERSPNLSPDGKWLAYDADDTGTPEIYVQRFSPDGATVTDRKRISTNGGRMAVWRRDGGELYFIAGDGQLVAVSVKTTDDTFEFGPPKALFATRMLGAVGSYHEFDVSPDGQRFLIGTLIGDIKAPPPTVILNWPAMVKK